MPKFNPNPTPLEIARRAAGLTRKQLAEKSGMSFDTLKSCELGRRSINNARAIDVISVAEVLGIPPRQILEGGESDA